MRVFLQPKKRGRRPIAIHPGIAEVTLMNIIRFTVSAAVVGVLSSTLAFAQTATPPDSTTNPSSASSPSQRDATRTPATEAPAASPDAATPHQREAMAAPKTMKECMDQQAAKKDGTSKSDMKKTCDARMKAQKDSTSR